MRLFEFNNCEFHETYPEYCDKIWNYLNDVGKVYFKRCHLEGLWRDFSDEKFDAGFMIPSDYSLEEFAYWLLERND